MATTQTPVAPPIDRAFAEDFGQRWIEAWNTHDAEAVLGLMDHDIVYDDSAWPKTMRGHSDVREFMESSWRAFPDLRFEIADGPYVEADAPKAAFYWKGYATHTGRIDPPGLEPTGKQIEMEGGDFHEYRDGKLVRLRIVFDVADTMRQLGVLPEPDTRGERLIMRLSNLQTRFRRRR
jgi:steroid delta-isomerase-like uncharacterized protein